MTRLLNPKAQFFATQDFVSGAEYNTQFFKGKTIYKHVEKTAQFISISEVLRKTIIYHDEVFNVMAEYMKLLKSFSQNGIILDRMQTEGKLKLQKIQKIEDFLVIWISPLPLKVLHQALGCFAVIF